MTQAGPEAVERHSSSRGSVELWVPAPGMLMSVIIGELTVELARPLSNAILRASTGAHRILGFADWWAMENYETAARQLLTDTAKRVVSRTEAYHVLLRSRVVALGIQAANLVLGNMQSYTDRTRFEQALSRATVERRLHANAKT